MKRYLKNTKRLVKNTVIILILGILLLVAYYLLGFNGNPVVYYTAILVAIIFGLHLWLIVISLHINRKE